MTSWIATFEKVRAAGAEVLQEPVDQPYGMRDCAFRDPSGNRPASVGMAASTFDRATSSVGLFRLTEQTVCMALTLMAVHAHPDDECSSTGGVLAKYAAEGVRTIVVTCTNGELGDGPGGIKPGDAGHDTEAVAATRRGELRRACGLLDVTHVELLGYHDSGMADWDYKDDERAFSAVPVDVAADRLAALLEAYEPDVVTTYCIDDGYEHPDHVQAHHVTLAAVARTRIPRKVYLSCIRASDFDVMMSSLREIGVDMSELEDNDGTWREKLAAAERRITTTVDVSSYVGQKREALAAHASQISESFFAKLPERVFAEAFGQESFIKVHDATGSAIPETDLFAGLR